MATLKIIAGTVYGNAQHVAEQVEENLAEQGVDCSLESDPSVADFTDADALLIRFYAFCHLLGLILRL